MELTTSLAQHVTADTENTSVILPTLLNLTRLVDGSQQPLT